MDFLVDFLLIAASIVIIIAFILIILIYIILICFPVSAFEHINSIPNVDGNPVYISFLSILIFIFFIILSGSGVYFRIMRNFNAVYDPSNSAIDPKKRANIIEFMNKQIYLYPFYVYIFMFVLTFLYITFYILSTSVLIKIITIYDTNIEIKCTHNLSYIIYIIIVSMFIVIPIHHLTLLCYRMIKKRPTTIEKIKKEFSKFSIVTILIITTTTILLGTMDFYGMNYAFDIRPAVNGNCLSSTLDMNTILFLVSLLFAAASINKLTRTQNNFREHKKDEQLKPSCFQKDEWVHDIPWLKKFLHRDHIRTNYDE